MADLTLGPFTIGIDNVSPDTTLAPGALRDAVNVDFDRAGGLNSRKGYRRLSTSVGHSGWKSRAAGLSFCVINGVVCSITLEDDSIQTLPLYTLAADLPVSFDDFLGSIVFANEAEIGVIAPDGSAKQLGLAVPPTPTVSVIAGALPGASGIAAGALKYGVAVSRVASNGEESGLSACTFVQAVPGSTLVVAGGDRVYMTGPSGDLLYRAGTPGAISTTVKLGRKARNQFLKRTLGGSIVRYWNGRLWTVQGPVLTFTQSMDYGLYDPRKGRIQFPGAIIMLEPVAAGRADGGLFVGVANDGVYFVAGERPDRFALRRTGGKAMISGISNRVDAGEVGDLGENLGARGELYPLWLARNGFVLGLPDGRIHELQHNHIRLPAEQWSATGALAVRNRQAIAVVNH